MSQRLHQQLSVHDLLTAQQSAWSAERNVLVGILQQALEDLNKKKHRLTVMHFFCSEEFKQLCRLLDYNADAIRNKLVPSPLQQQLMTAPYTMPFELRERRGRPRGSAKLHQKPQQNQQHQQDELDLVELVDDFQPPAPIVYAHTFDSRSIRNDDCTAAL